MTSVPELYAGLISGTSMDGIDAALLAFSEQRCDTIATRSHPYPDALRDELLRVSRDPDSCTLDDLGRLDRRVGECFRDAALHLLAESQTDAGDVIAIGSHGQTLRHRPDADAPFTLQIGDPNVIATGTSITTVADFRRRDLAAGGEAAPLTPAFHAWLFGDDAEDRVVLNIGGIANVTILPADSGNVTGFDTGPGNTLLDAWIREQKNQPFDEDGRWAASATASAELLERMLADPYFGRPAPKSTGFEHFDLAWIERMFGDDPTPPETVQATLLDLTVDSITQQIRKLAPTAGRIMVCGGGVHNGAMMQALGAALTPTPVVSTAESGLDPDWVEAAAFAWLARQTLAGQPGNLPSVTGARGAEVLGGIYLCAS